MSDSAASTPTDDGETTVYTIRGIKKSLDKTITDLATAYRKPKATLLREFIEMGFSDHVRNFGLHNSLVKTFDAEIADFIGVPLMTEPVDDFHITRHNHEFLQLLGIRDEEGLRTLLLNNAPYLRLRARQTLGGCTRVPRTTSLAFAMFAELASRDAGTIGDAHARLFPSLSQEGYDRFYRHINEIRAEMKRPVLLPDTEISEKGENVIVTIYSPKGYGDECWKIHISLRQGVRSPGVAFRFPNLERRVFIPDPPYRKVVISDSDEWDMGFCFTDGVCELHLYSNGIPESENPVPLPIVAQALIAAIENQMGH
ncbi:hypothetical protein ABRP83_13435 [Pectobacterium brasiliense]|uniref:hypothetical protein n=1 Tax=Pectobacterium brasiliense TaxID=180957 RepID=UPI0032EF5C18